MFLTIKLCTKWFEIEPFIWIKMDLALNNPQRLICHKIQTNKQHWFIAIIRPVKQYL